MPPDEGELMSKRPIHFLIFKIIGVAGIAAAVYGAVLAIRGFGDFESNNFMIGGFLATFGLFVGVACILIGFRPEIARMNAKSMRYIQEENKDDLSAIASNTADIMSDAVKTTASAVGEGMRATKFCKHCGEKIDADAKFCPSCGEGQ